jgi:excisionase family DNA binding protein
MNKEEAAQFLGVSVRALERYTNQGRVSVRYERGKTRSVAIYESADLEVLKADLERPTLRPATVETPTNSDSLRHEEADGETVEGEAIESPAGTATDPDATTLARFVGFGEVTTDPRTAHAAALMLARLLTLAQSAQDAQQSAPRSRPEPDATQAAAKLLLTLAEAQTLTGLSRAVLRAAIDTGELPARQIGRAWRVKRAELERWIQTL